MTIHILPGRLDTAAAECLRQTLSARAASGQPILLDGAKVEQVGQACLQVLVSARVTAATRDIAFVIDDPSAAFLEGCAIAGLSALVQTN